MNYSIEDHENETVVSVKLPEWHKSDSESDERLTSALIDAGAPKWIDGDFDDSGVLDGVWWVSINRIKVVTALLNEADLIKKIQASVKPEKIADMDAWLLGVFNEAWERCDYQEYLAGGYDYELSQHDTISGHTESISVELEWSDERVIELNQQHKPNGAKKMNIISVDIEKFDQAENEDTVVIILEDGNEWHVQRLNGEFNQMMGCEIELNNDPHFVGHEDLVLELIKVADKAQLIKVSDKA